MAVRFGDDGLCTHCKTFTKHFCDSCGLAICEECGKIREYPNAVKTHIMCKDCAGNGGKPLYATIFAVNKHSTIF